MALIVAREPSLFLEPRFWAEEGTYFQHALYHGWFDALVHVSVAPHVPYWHPIPHLSAIAAAHWVPLEYAPAVTSGAWCAVVLALALVVLYGRAELLASPWRRAAGLIAPLIAVANSETWVSSHQAHYYCDIALLLLMLEADKVEGRRRVLSLSAFAVFAVLSPTNWLLVPAAAIVAYRASPRARTYLYVLLAAVILHVGMSMLLFPKSTRPPPELAAVPHLFLVKLVLWPTVGHRVAQAYADFAIAASNATYYGLSFLLGLSVIALYAGAWLASRRDRTTLVLLATHATTAGAAFLLGLQVGKSLLPVFHGGRYAFFPNALVFLFLIHQLDATRATTRAPRQGVFAAVFAAALAGAVVQFRFPEAVRNWAKGPAWREEVATFRENPAYDQLQIAPAGWAVSIPVGVGAPTDNGNVELEKH